MSGLPAASTICLWSVWANCALAAGVNTRRNESSRKVICLMMISAASLYQTATNARAENGASLLSPENTSALSLSAQNPSRDNCLARESHCSIPLFAWLWHACVPHSPARRIEDHHEAASNRRRPAGDL